MPSLRLILTSSYLCLLAAASSGQSKPFARLGHPAAPNKSANRPRQIFETCPAGDVKCGTEYCLPVVGYFCCADGLGGCKTGWTCYPKGCCPPGSKCTGVGPGISTIWELPPSTPLTHDTSTELLATPTQLSNDVSATAETPSQPAEETPSQPTGTQEPSNQVTVTVMPTQSTPSSNDGGDNVPTTSAGGNAIPPPITPGGASELKVVLLGSVMAAGVAVGALILL